MPPNALHLTEQQLATLIAQARAHAGVEVCGLLGGRGERVLGVYPVRNTSPIPAVHFLMDDQSFVDAYLDIEGRGWELVAIYHSHPAGARTDPSPTDIANANYPDALDLIISLDLAGRPTARAFRIADEQATEVALEVSPD